MNTEFPVSVKLKRKTGSHNPCLIALCEVFGAQ